MASAPSNPRASRDDAAAIVRRLRDAGHVAYFAGGCVRDLLLGQQPKDYDVATDAPPEKVRQIFSNTQAVGAAFGVILVRLGNTQFEVATFRKDLAYEDGRHPVGVRFATAEEDAQRRDFTINGMFLDPIDDRVIDFVGGKNDLQAKILRAIGEPEARFAEDHLRLLRAIRFASRFGLTIEPRTAGAIAHHAEHLKRISPERIAEELRLMLIPPTRTAAWGWLWQFKLVHVLFRTMTEHPEAPPCALFPSLIAGEAISFGLALATMALEYRWPSDNRDLLRMLDQAEIQKTVRACRTTLKTSNDESDRLAGVLFLAPLLGTPEPRVACMKRFLASPFGADARHLLDALASAGVFNQRIDWLKQEFIDLAKTDVAPPPLLTGDDLVAAGFNPGKVFKQVLSDVYDAQLEDRIASRDEALKLAVSMIRS